LGLKNERQTLKSLTPPEAAQELELDKPIEKI